ncbi:MAG: PilW family protein [Betaproteobacteria bacterium]
MRLGACARGPQRGVALLEWMVAHSLGLVVVAAATSLFLHQARVAMALHQRQLQLQDLGVVAQVLRAELRTPGIGPAGADVEVLAAGRVCGGWHHTLHVQCAGACIRQRQRGAQRPAG